MLIDCESCRARGVGCSNCVISLFIDGAAGVNAVDLNDSERQALEVLRRGWSGAAVTAGSDGRRAAVRWSQSRPRRGLNAACREAPGAGCSYRGLRRFRRRLWTGLGTRMKHAADTPELASAHTIS